MILKTVQIVGAIALLGSLSCLQGVDDGKNKKEKRGCFGWLCGSKKSSTKIYNAPDEVAINLVLSGNRSCFKKIEYLFVANNKDNDTNENVLFQIGKAKINVNPKILRGHQLILYIDKDGNRNDIIKSFHGCMCINDGGFSSYLQKLPGDNDTFKLCAVDCPLMSFELLNYRIGKEITKSWSMSCMP